MRIAVLGAGSWGTTLAVVLAENAHDVELWDHDGPRAQITQSMRENTRYLRGVKLPDNIAVTSELALAIGNALMVVFAVPSHTMRETACSVAASKALGEDAVIVTASKGLEEGTHRRMSEILAEELGV
jgi:glycerol-3-phosphate dehydrogenase (NAD(P)+)